MSLHKVSLSLYAALQTGILALSGSGGAAASPTDEVKTQLEQGRFREAYEAARAAPDALGTPLFDFYFGIAALNAGAPGEGVLALERYLLQFPDNRSAQFQLARGYFILGDDPRAKEEFSALAVGANPVETERIQQFLDAIRTRESRYRPSVSGFMEFGAGHDSNINSGIVAGQVAGLPLGVVVQPGQSSERQSDRFGMAAAGVQGVYPVAPGVALYGGVQLSGRVHQQPRNDVFKTTLSGVQAGVSLVDGRHLYRAGMDMTRVGLASQPYLNLSTLVGEWQYQHDQYNRIGATVQWSDQRYHSIDTYLDLDKTIRVNASGDGRDSRLTHLATFWTHTAPHNWKPEWTLGLNAGSDRNLQSRADLSRDLWGARSAVTVQPYARWTFAAGLSYQSSRYGAEFSEGVPARQDDYFAWDLSATCALSRHWTLRGEYQWVDQRSTIGFFKYRREQLAAKLRYDFR